jgi:hypothetical protein
VGLKTKFDPIDRDFALVIKQEFSAEAQGKILRDFALQALAEGQDQNKAALGYVPDHDAYVDGRRNDSLSGVTGRSSITFEFHLLFEVLEWIDEQLILHSPVRSGKFAKSHVWFANDVEMDPLNPPAAEEYVVLNAQPYARKIERGLSPQAPEGVYEGVAALARRRFGNIAHIRFGFRSFPSGAVGNWAGSASAAALAREIRGGNPAGHLEWLTRQPCIYIDPGVK